MIKINLIKYIFLIMIAYVLSYATSFVLISEATGTLNIPITIFIFGLIYFFVITLPLKFYNKLAISKNEISLGIFVSSIILFISVLILNIYTVNNINAQLSGLIAMDRTASLSLFNTYVILLLFLTTFILTFVIDAIVFRKKGIKPLKILKASFVYYLILLLLIILSNYALNIIFLIMS